MNINSTKGKFVYIGIGSNFKSPKDQVMSGINSINQIKEIMIKAQSSLYRSAPLDNSDQPDFINAVVLVYTNLNPSLLLEKLNEIEDNHNRDRTLPQWGPRTLDLDLLLYDNEVINKPNLVVPHPGISKRNFVLIPMLEITSDIEIPGLGFAKELLEKRKSNSGEEFIYSGPTGLPTDLGEREMLLINAMESALQEGHSREYQNMMKQYFRSLQQGGNSQSE